VLERRGRFLVALPLFARAGPGASASQLTVSLARSGAAPGDLVLVSIRPSRRGGRAEIVRRLGRPDIARDVIEALMLDRGLARGFEPAVEREAREASGAVAQRRDLREVATFTIDPASARDFDDAISAERTTGGTIRVHVHIADVAAFVTPGSLVDREARRRATSVYVPGAVEPMLPGALSNEKCSLVAGEDRLAVSVELELAGARVVRASFGRSLIRSDERLDYDRVDRIFAGREAAAEPWASALDAAREAAAALGAERMRRGGLELEGGEPEFDFDRAGRIRSMRVPEQTEAHRLIEHLMIAANEQVAKLLADRGEPALYRVHEEPDPQRVERLVAALASLGVPTPPVGERLSPSQAGELVGLISQAVERYTRTEGRGKRAFASLILRSLKQAYYSPRNVGHAGLRSPRYCHFTSPIRRYPDLVCHRALLAAIGAGEHGPDATALGELGQWTSLREREAIDVERAADDIARCFLLARQDDERTWEGEVVGLIGAGAFVAFGDGYEGMLAMRRLRGGHADRGTGNAARGTGQAGRGTSQAGRGSGQVGRGMGQAGRGTGQAARGTAWWELNEEATILHETRGGGTIRLGDPIRVRVRGIDAVRGRVDLEPA
jgi:ribonuclease R